MLVRFLAPLWPFFTSFFSSTPTCITDIMRFILPPQKPNFDQSFVLVLLDWLYD